MGSTDRHGKHETHLLARRLAAGDATAIAALYRKYYHRLLGYGLQIPGNFPKPELEDVIQELFIWLAENSCRTDSIENFEAYLFQSFRRNLQSKYTKRERNRNSLQKYIQHHLSNADNNFRSPEQLRIDHEEQDQLRLLVRKQLEQLPDYQREVLYLRYFENKSYPEIAAILSVSQQVAYNYVSRGIKKLKELFANTAITHLYWLLLFWANF